MKRVVRGRGGAGGMAPLLWVRLILGSEGCVCRQVGGQDSASHSQAAAPGQPRGEQEGRLWLGLPQAPVTPVLLSLGLGWAPCPAEAATPLSSPFRRVLRARRTCSAQYLWGEVAHKVANAALLGTDGRVLVSGVAPAHPTGEVHPHGEARPAAQP